MKHLGAILSCHSVQCSSQRAPDFLLFSAAIRGKTQQWETAFFHNAVLFLVPRLLFASGSVKCSSINFNGQNGLLIHLPEQ